jgi:hypothetical protein
MDRPQGTALELRASLLMTLGMRDAQNVRRDVGILLGRVYINPLAPEFYV